MTQDIKFQGLSSSPSDYDAQDGELGTLLNLVNEDGALKPIHQPIVTDSNITIPDGATVELVHKVTHENTIHSHYIIRRADDTWCWTEKDGDGTFTDIDLDGFKVNAVTAVGNILNFVGDTNIMYAYWKTNVYTIFSRDRFTYSITLQTSHSEFGPYIAEMGDEFYDCLKWYQNSDEKKIQGMLASGTRKAYNAVQSCVNKKLSELGSVFMSGLVFGVAAVRLYDNESYINISNVFTLTPYDIPNEIKFSTYSDSTSSGKEKFFSMYADTYQTNISVDMDTNGLEDIVDGIDIFLTDGDSYLNLDVAINDIKDAEGGITDVSALKGKFVIPRLSGAALYDSVESKPFYHSLFISKEDFGKEKDLQKPVKTEKTISLADPNRCSLGAHYAITYNNRLHLGNVNSGQFKIFSYNSTRWFNFVLIDHSYGTGFYTIPSKELGDFTDLPYNDSSIASIRGRTIECILCITINTINNYFHGSIQYPIPPMITVPTTDASMVVMLINLEGKYYKKTLPLHKSDSWGYNYYLNNMNGKLSYFQVNDVAFEVTNGVIYKNPTCTLNGQFVSTTEDEWNRCLELCDRENNIVKQSPSLVKVSEVENPLVFPAKNSVQVGSSIINALAANTRPISEGQFGEAPLYAFTDEGVWTLMTSSEGTYEARQPANREICTNPKSILQIDDAVLFTTERGIMLQNGKNAECITDVLDGYPFDFTQLYKEDFAKKVLAVGNISEEAVKYVRFRDYLQSADMIYDYYDNRIIVFNPAYPYAYVYSLKSKTWSTMANTINKRVNIYPESYGVNKDGKLVDVYVKEPADSVSYFLCSRPLGLGTPEVFKTMFTAITRGYFRGTEAGKCGMVLYGSNDLFHWYLIKSSVDKYLRGMMGSPYKYFRIALIGSLLPDESITGMSADFTERWQNKLR